MKIKRYAFGRTNVSERQSQRAGLMSPAQAAAGAAAPWQAASDVSRETSATLFALHESNERIKAAESKVTVSNLKNQTNALVAEAEREAKEFGWSPEIYEKRVQSILKGYEAGLAQVESPEIRRLAQQTVVGEHAVITENALATSGTMRAERATEAWNQGIVVANDLLENTPPERRDYRDLRTHIEAGMEAGVIEASDGIKRLQAVDDMEVGNELFIGYKQAVDKGPEAVAAYEEKLAEGTYTDGAIATYKSEKDQFDSLMKKSVQKAEEERQAEFYTTAVENDIRAKNNLFSSDANALALEGMEYGDPKSMAARQRWAMVERSIDAANRKTENEINYGNAIDNQLIVEATPKNRKGLDDAYQARRDGRNIEEGTYADRVMQADIAQATGTATETTRLTLEAAGQRKPTYEQLELFSLLMDGVQGQTFTNPDGDEIFVAGTLPDIGLSKEAMHVLSDAYWFSKAGSDPNQSIEIAWDNRVPLSDAERETRTIQLEQVDKDTVFAEAFYELSPTKGTLTHMLSSKMNVAQDAPLQARAEWDNLFDESYMRSGSVAVATANANFAMQQKWRPSNLNTNDPNTYVLTDDPVVTDATFIKRDTTALLNDSGRKFRVRDPETGTPRTVAELDGKDLGFYFDRKTRDGDYIYVMSYGGIPFTYETGGTVEFEMSAEEAAKYQQNEKLRMAAQEEIEISKAVIERYERRVEKGTPNIYASPEERATYEAEAQTMLDKAGFRLEAAEKRLQAVPADVELEF